MLSFIGSILKYSLLVLTILVLSHIIEIRGTSISKHVENGIGWRSNSKSEVTQITRNMGSAIRTRLKSEPSDQPSSDEEAELHQVIRRSNR